jgi:hypothetical protein
MRGIKDFNFPEFDRIAKQIRKQGYTVWSPAENNPLDRSFEKCMTVDLNSIINQCSSIALLTEWRLSTGANVEVFVGNACGKNIYEINENKETGHIIFNRLDSKKYILPYENYCLCP